MSAMYPTMAEQRNANGIARRFTRMAVEGRREDTMRFFALASAMMDAAVDAGVSGEWLADFAKGLHDELSNLDAGMERDLDNVGALSEWQPIDLTDLDRLLEQFS